MQLKIPDNSSISKTELLKMQDTIESWMECTRGTT